MKFQLKNKFQYVHEPLSLKESAIPFLENQSLVDLLKDRISHSTGGAFLVTGFRGSGKTTVIKRAIEEHTTDESNKATLIPVFINVARPLNTIQLMFEIIRRFFETLIDLGILEKLEPKIANAINLAYARTSLSFKNTQSQSLEKGSSLNIGDSEPKVVLSPVTNIINSLKPKLSFSRKKTSFLAKETSFLTYTETDVEHDFLRIIEFLNKSRINYSFKLWQRLLSVLHIKKKSFLRKPIKLIVILDELDKLTENEEGIQTFDNLLISMKNILSTHSVFFIFIGGTELKDANRGNSIYESIFSFQTYIPCVWNAAHLLLDELISSSEKDSKELSLFREHLSFKGRGIFRRLLQEFYSFVKWEDNRPYIEINSFDLQRISFYAKLQLIIKMYRMSLDVDSIFQLFIDQDRWSLGTYFITDRILETEGKTFTIHDICPSTQPSMINRALFLTAKQSEKLIDHLIKNNILEEVRKSSPDQTFIGDIPLVQERVFRITRDVQKILTLFKRMSEKERAGKISVASDTTLAFDEAFPRNIEHKFRSDLKYRYEIYGEIGRGGMGVVFKAYDFWLEKKVALKLLPTHIWEDSKAIERFMREAEIAMMLNHSNVVKTLDIVKYDSRYIFIVMELITGRNLRAIIESERISKKRAVTIILHTVNALEYAHSKGVCRLDIKPSNIVLEESGKPVLVDFGLAKIASKIKKEIKVSETTLTESGAIIGTPKYMAPEQIRGLEEDIRADIYSLGIVLFEMISGKSPWTSKHTPLLFNEILTKKVDVSNLNISNELKEVICLATQPDLSKRFQKPKDMKDALLKTPEAKAVKLIHNKDE